MSRLDEVIARHARRIDAVISCIDAGDLAGTQAAITQIHLAAPWELAAAGQAFASAMLEAEDSADGIVSEPDAGTTEAS